MKKVKTGALIQYIGTNVDTHIYLVINKRSYLHIRYIKEEGRIEGTLYHERVNWNHFLSTTPDEWKLL